MVYFCLKILHIISAALLLMSMAYSYRLWRYTQSPQEAAINLQRIQTQTWLVIIPLAVIQLATGFSIISVQHYDMSESWISGSVIGFITVIGSWFTFIYLMLLSQQAEVDTQKRGGKFKYYRRLQSIMLTICGFALLVMIFLMANKT